MQLIENDKWGEKERLQRIGESLYVYRDTCNVYVIRRGQKAVLIDFGSGEVMKVLEDLQISCVEAVLVTHHHRDQVEGLYIDKNVSFTDLKQVLLQFAQEMFGPETKIRLRPSYFPFTEPSAEMDISCDICGGEGCPFCKYTGWVEILGCGMVDPAVLEANGIDSKVYTGYAFGMGVERITNLKYKVKDLRMFSENDTRFLEEFESAN